MNCRSFLSPSSVISVGSFLNWAAKIRTFLLPANFFTLFLQKICTFFFSRECGRDRQKAHSVDYKTVIQIQLRKCRQRLFFVFHTPLFSSRHSSNKFGSALDLSKRFKKIGHARKHDRNLSTARHQFFSTKREMMFRMTFDAFSMDSSGTYSSLPWKLCPPAKMFGQGSPMKERFAPSVPPRMG